MGEETQQQGEELAAPSSPTGSVAASVAPSLGSESAKSTASTTASSVASSTKLENWDMVTFDPFSTEQQRKDKLANYFAQTISRYWVLIGLCLQIYPMGVQGLLLCLSLLVELA